MNKRKFLKTLSAFSILSPISLSAFSLTATKSELEKAIFRCGITAKQYDIELDYLEDIINEFLFVKNDGNLVGNTLKTILIRLNRQEVLDKINNLLYSYLQKDLFRINSLSLSTNTLDNLFRLAMDYTSINEEKKSQLVELIGGVYHYKLVQGFMENFWVCDDNQKIKL